MPAATTALPVTAGTTPAQDDKPYLMDQLVGMQYTSVDSSPTYDHIIFIPEYDYSETYVIGTIYEQDIPENTAIGDKTEVHVKVS